MFLLSSGLSRFIKRDSFRGNSNLLFSFKRIVKSSELVSWPFNKMWSKRADFLGFFTHFPVKGVIPRCSEALKKSAIFEPQKVSSFDHILLKGHDASFEDFTENKAWRKSWADIHFRLKVSQPFRGMVSIFVLNKNVCVVFNFPSCSWRLSWPGVCFRSSWY